MDNDAKTSVGDWVFYAVLVLFLVLGAVFALGQPGNELIPEGGFLWKPFGVGSHWDMLGMLIGFGLTLAFYSFLYKDNPFFKAAEHFYVGVGLGYLVVTSWFLYIKSELYYPLVKYWVRDGVPGQPDLTLIVPLILGAFLLARFIKPLAWLSRWAFAFIVGFGSGQAMPTIINANVLRQLEYTLIPINDLSIQSISLAITCVGVLSVLVYFYFSMEHKGIVGGISKVGIWFLMISFGASFGYTVMGRMALFIKRALWVADDFMKLNIGG